jgi:hypothetical protein
MLRKTDFEFAESAAALLAAEANSSEPTTPFP